MAFIYSQEFWGPKGHDSALYVFCAIHDQRVETNWSKLNPNTPAEVYEVLCKPVHPDCRPHFGDTDTIIIARPAWDAAAPQHQWQCFVTP